MRTGVWGQLVNYIKFRLYSKPVGGHGIHSPYVYKLYTEVIERDNKNTIFEKIEGYRKELKRCGLSIIRKSIAENINAGYRGEEVSLRKIAKTVSIPPHLGRLLFRLCSHYQPKSIVELGTSVGISSMYLAAGNNNASLYTVEGDETVLGIAQARFRQYGMNNIQTFPGSFEDQLPHILSELKTVDMVFIDGDHNGRALINYFDQILSKTNENSIVVIDDIRWSKGMERAWNYICDYPQVSVSIDLFRCGVLIFEKGITKQHFTLRYGPY